MLTLRDEDGVEQSLQVTEEHPFFDKLRGWTKAKSLTAGDAVLGAASELAVVSNIHAPHPDGVTVYNLEVANEHTYFVRAEVAEGEAVWVHNAGYPETTASFEHKKYVQDVLGSEIPKEVPFNTDGMASTGLGSRRYDAFDAVTGSAFEGNTTPWSTITMEKLQFKLAQAGADVALRAEGAAGLNPIRKIIWFGTEELPTSGLGRQLREALERADIQYYVVKT